MAAVSQRCIYMAVNSSVTALWNVSAVCVGSLEMSTCFSLPVIFYDKCVSEVLSSCFWILILNADVIIYSNMKMYFSTSCDVQAAIGMDSRLLCKEFF